MMIFEHLCMKEGSLFVLFVHHVEASQTMAPLVTILYHWKALDKYKCVKMVF
jgi:hypothetical protein